MGNLQKESYKKVKGLKYITRSYKYLFLVEALRGEGAEGSQDQACTLTKRNFLYENENNRHKSL